MTTAQMQAAMDNGRCPSDLATVAFLDYKPACGPEPSDPSRAYLSCQNRVDHENGVIAKYNDFVRKCIAQARAGTNNDLSQRYKSQQSITKQSEEQGTKEKYQQQIQKEENQDADQKSEATLAEQRKKLDADKAQQQANQGAEKAKADAVRQPSIMPAVVPPPPKLQLTEAPPYLSGSTAANFLATHGDSGPDCHKQDGLTVCTSSIHWNTSVKERYRGQCLDVRTYSGQICHIRGTQNFDYRGDYDHDFCVDVICVSADMKPW